MSKRLCSNCYKVYFSSRSLWNHKQKCKNKTKNGGALLPIEELLEKLKSNAIDSVERVKLENMFEKLSQPYKRDKNIIYNVIKHETKDNKKGEKPEYTEEDEHTNITAEKLYHDLILKDKKEVEKMIKDIQNSEFAYRGNEIKDLFEEYLSAKKDNRSLKYFNHIVRILHAKWSNAAEYLRASEMELLIARIDVTRKTVHKLFHGLTINKNKLLSYLLSLQPDLIDLEEFEHLIHDFNPETIEKVLKQTPRTVK